MPNVGSDANWLWQSFGCGAHSHRLTGDGVCLKPSGLRHATTGQIDHPDIPSLCHPLDIFWLAQTLKATRVSRAVGRAGGPAFSPGRCFELEILCHDLFTAQPTNAMVTSWETSPMINCRGGWDCCTDLLADASQSATPAIFEDPGVNMNSLRCVRQKANFVSYYRS